MSSTPASLAWDHILGNALPMQTLEQLREAFSDREFLEEYDFSFIHQVVLGIKPVDLHQALNQYPALVDHADTKGNTALLWAARRGEVGHVKALLKAGANFKSMNNVGSDPLFAAVMNGRLECMKVLLSAGAVLQLDSQNKSALHSACNARDDVEYVKVLLGRETNINHKDIFDRSPLNFASWRNHFRVVKYLLEAGADIETRDFFGATALLRAVQYAAVDVARVLMDYGANPNAVDNNSQTILHRAALSRNKAILEFLATRLELSSVDIEAKNNSDLTARECLLQLQPSVELLEAFESLTQAIRKAIEIAKAERRQLSLKEACYRVIELDPSPSGTGSSTPLPFADAVEYQHTSGSDDDSIRWFLSRRGGPRERTIDRLKRKARHVQERGKSWTDKYSRKFRSFSSLGGSSVFKGSFDC
jgi:ankyrin repeat protein